MTRIAIAGGGPTATLHAEAVRATAGAELVGVGGGQGWAEDLASALSVDHLTLDQLVDRAEALVVAVPPAEVAAVVATAVGRVRAMLLEPPIATTVAATRLLPAATATALMTGANLLHSSEVRRGLRAVAAMSAPHHFALRALTPQPAPGSHRSEALGGGALLDPGTRLLPVLLAACATPVLSVSARIDHVDGIDNLAHLSLGLADGRRAGAAFEWVDGETHADLEVADSAGVVSIELLPRPAFARDGTSLSDPIPDPLVALGFVDQIRRLAAVARGDADPWADLGVGIGALTLVTTAAASAAAGGIEVRCADVAADASPLALLRGQ